MPDRGCGKHCKHYIHRRLVANLFCHRDFASLENSSFLTSDARSSRKAWNWREDDFFLDEKGFSKKRFLNCEPPGRGKETGSAGSWRVPSPTFGGELKQWGWGQEAQVWRRSSFPSHNLNLWWSPTRASTEIIGIQQKGGDCLGTPTPSKTDEFSEKFQGGGGHFQSKNLYCRFWEL